MRLPRPRGLDADAARGDRGDDAVPRRPSRESVGRPRGVAGHEDRARRGARDGRRRAAAAVRTRSCSPAAAARATTSRSRARRGRRAPPSAARRRRHERDRAQGGARRVRPARARGLPRRRGCRPTADGVVDLDALGGALDERTAVVSVMLVNNETGVRPAARRDRRARARARAPQRGRAHRRGAGAAVARLARPRPRTPTSSRSRATSSADRRASARSSCATACRLVPLVEGGGHERGLRAGTQNVAGHRRVRDRAARHARAARRGDGAHRRAARRARARAARAQVAGFAVNGDRDAARRRAPALHVRRRRGRDAARRARPARRHGGVGLGVQLRCGRSVARAARDGHAARPRAVVGALLARLRVDRGRRRHRARASCPEVVAKLRAA